MIRFRPHQPSCGAAVRRALAIGFCWLLATGCAIASSPSSAKTPHNPAAHSAKLPDPETLLIEVYKDLGANELRKAQQKADALVQAYPNFRLGHLIRGDLLLMSTRPVETFGAVADAPDDKLKNLRDEAMVRLKFLRERPDPNLVPQMVLKLRDDQKHVLVADTKRSRLYLYEHRRGQLKFIDDYYISQGKLGVHKLKEGDQKTPIGVYYIIARLPGARLPDFYGPGALPINYPNEWDKLHGRGGSGIWLHGTPSDSYSRPPLSSDGCVVLTNPDLRELADTVEVGKTPIVISESVEFVSKATWEHDRDAAAKLVEGWRRDAEGLDPALLKAHYSSQFKSERGEDLASWFPKQYPNAGRVKKLSIKLRDTTYFYYPDRNDMLVSTFTEDASVGKSKSSTRKRQYWIKEKEQWKIVYEFTL